MPPARERPLGVISRSSENLTTIFSWNAPHRNDVSIVSKITVMGIKYGIFASPVGWTVMMVTKWPKSTKLCGKSGLVAKRISRIQVLFIN